MQKCGKDKEAFKYEKDLLRYGEIMTRRNPKRRKLLEEMPKSPDDVLDKAKPVEDKDPIFGLDIIVPKGLKDIKDTLED